MQRLSIKLKWAILASLFISFGTISLYSETLSFKGLRLGMTRVELDSFLKESCWDKRELLKNGDLIIGEKFFENRWFGLKEAEG